MLLIVLASLLAGANASFSGEKQQQKSREIVNPFSKSVIPFSQLYQMHKSSMHSANQNSGESSFKSPLHYLKGTPLQDLSHQYLPNLEISQSSFAEEAAKVEAQLKLASNTSAHSPPIRPAFRKDFKVKVNSSAFYYGQENSSTGFRHGNGLLVSLKSGKIYLGGWCRNARNGLGVTLTPKKSVLGMRHMNCHMYTVGLHRWKMGFIQDSDIEGKELLGGTLFAQLALLNTKGFSLVGLIDLFHCMVDSKRISAENSCISSGFASESEAEKPIFQKVYFDNTFNAKDSSTGVYQLKPSLQHSVWVPFEVEEDSTGYLQVFSYKENYHPTAKLFRYNSGRSESKKTLLGHELGSGNAIKTEFMKGTKYFVEVGIPSSNNSISSIEKGKFRLIITKEIPLHKVYGKTSSTVDEYSFFKIKIGGKFSKGGILSYTERIGTWSQSIAPFFDSSKRCVTWFYLDGAWCGAKRKVGKLEVVYQSPKDDFDLNDIKEEESGCVYTAYADSKYVEWIIAKLSEDGKKQRTDEDE
jgi:hypothetical protein